MQLGHQTPLPIEVVPFAARPSASDWRRLEHRCSCVRCLGESVYLTENGNVILDCCFANGIVDPTDLEDRIRRIVGVVETGLFLHIAEQAIIGGPPGDTVPPPNFGRMSFYTRNNFEGTSSKMKDDYGRR